MGWRISRAGGSNPPPPPPVVVVVGDGLQNVCLSRAVWLKGWAVLTASMQGLGHKRCSFLFDFHN